MYRESFLTFIKKLILLLLLLSLLFYILFLFREEYINEIQCNNDNNFLQINFFAYKLKKCYIFVRFVKNFNLQHIYRVHSSSDGL